MAERLIQPNPWSCLPTAFAMVSGIDFESIIKAIGHDGSEIRYPELKPPFDRRGFQHVEMQRAAWKLGWILTPFFKTVSFNGGCEYHSLRPFMEDNDGILLNESHAVAWIDGKILNPSDGPFEAPLLFLAANPRIKSI